MLTGGGYVGVISVPELDMYVTPKIEPLAVFWMLAYADGLVRFSQTEVAFATEDGVLEILVRLFARRTRSSSVEGCIATTWSGPRTCRL